MDIFLYWLLPSPHASEQLKWIYIFCTFPNRYPRCGARTRDPKIKSPMLYRLSQPDTTPHIQSMNYLSLPSVVEIQKGLCILSSQSQYMNSAKPDIHPSRSMASEGTKPVWLSKFAPWTNSNSITWKLANSWASPWTYRTGKTLRVGPTHVRLKKPSRCF